MIRRAKILEIPEILSIAMACAKDMINKGIYQWNSDYPSQAAFKNDIQRKELYVLEINGKIKGMITITTIKDEEYMPVAWLTSTDNAMYIHRLGVDPEFQGMGYAQQLMNYAEDYAKVSGFASVRLDTFSRNKRNQKFYEQRGYQKLSDIYFPKQSKYPFHCYELVF
ncbi:GNAT family N-acetyltransferase [Muriicola sp. Z0-33]|uniref:GNAT family N-acetyltransferase n=1 Tax=Muriicola sp. Z0-33 TaxID=2816957 RepID=UPI002238F47D|nr:GNAT family N-acetyltransferase [Muriicola sp. Z0-33]MCW5514809.1 GNAT family N-acetyltransferase [Muriicola sp. Z0-33]